MPPSLEKRALPAKISIVVPIYNESNGITECLQRIVTVVKPIGIDWEIVCIDDGSTDDTLSKLTSYHGNYSNVKVISLSRNFGKEVALSAGLDHAEGEVVIPIDSDLQDPPELISDMIKKWQEGFDVVLAVRNPSPHTQSLRVLSAKLFYLLIDKISDIKITKNTGDFRLLDRKVVEAIRQMPERTRFMKGIMSWAGFRTSHIYFDRPLRREGQSRWSFIQLLKLAADGIFSFSSYPVRFIGLAGGCLLTCSILAFLWAGLFSSYDSLYTLVFNATLFICGVNLLAIWLVGEYVVRISQDVRQRPLYVIDHKIGY